MPRAAEWHLVTGEFPPDSGGVGDYTARLADGLGQAGERVTVWCPGASGPLPSGGSRRDATFDPRGIARLARSLAQREAKRRLVVQYVPQAFGLRGVNVPFCLWLVWRRFVRGDDVDVMFHEPYLELDTSRSLRWNAAALAQRFMAALALVAARRVWISIPAWSRYLRPYGLLAGRMRWLPIPSTIVPVRDEDAVAALRRELASEVVVGHFGTFSREVIDLLEPVLVEVLRGEASILLLGRGSSAFAARLGHASRVRALDGASADRLSVALQACDLLVQPYPDGVSTRRTTAMAALCHGRALATTEGPLTERIWRDQGLASLARDPRALAVEARRLIDDAGARRALATRGREAYERLFAIERTVASLREAGR